MATTSFTDTEFGEVQIRYRHNTRSIAFRYTPAGVLTISAPLRTPVFLLKQSLSHSRKSVRSLQTSIASPLYSDGQAIGKSHRIVIVTASVTSPQLKVTERIVRVSLPVAVEPSSSEVQTLIRQHVIKILRKEAKAYLPRRLKLLAERYGYNYEQVRFSHASSRWGSCSSRGTISLNIALMSAPLELIDYVLIHELCHTREMNHSPAFWQRVEAADPHYQLHRKQMKQYSPHV